MQRVFIILYRFFQYFSLCDCNDKLINIWNCIEKGKQTKRARANQNAGKRESKELLSMEDITKLGVAFAAPIIVLKVLGARKCVLVCTI